METPAAAVSLALFFLSWLFYQRFLCANNDEFQTVPRSKKAANPIAEALARGYQAFSKPLGKPFYIIYWTKRLLILPPKYLGDIRRANRDHLRFQPAINEMLFQYKWLGDSIKTELNQAVIIKGINPQLPKLSGPLIEESEFALDLTVGDSPDGREVSAVEFANDISLRTFSRVLGGKALSRDQTYIDAFNAWSTGNMMTGFLTLMIPFHALRHTIGWPLAMYQKHVRQRRLHNLAKVHVVRRMEEEKSGMYDSTEVDALQLAMNLLPRHLPDQASSTSPTDLLAAQLWQLTWAGAQSPSMTLANMLVKVLETPAHCEVLREEVNAAIESQGWSDAMLNQMPLMDSFIREVQRLYPIMSVNVERKVMNQPFTFSDGLTLPKGTVFAFPASSCALDSDLVANPDEFDPYRFVKLSKQDAERGESDNRWAASQAGTTNMAFGYGNHVCPGRFLAVRGLRIIFARILIGYEVSWNRTDGKAPRMVMEGLSIPDPSQKVTIKRRLL
ncbi:cytochrome P450 [Periconia macrospinosa]|uniref:Cytochrome P450 n=1 Tax=Periconia macrospinosa TaxID=97972 RepID=A0A2V1E0H3_9PLEO|nr:cytochrome P450 [Periconia macrospinosa]